VRVVQYVQTVFARIAAAKLDAATRPEGLLAALQAHRDFAAGQRT
jgi:hypothetical protein